MNKTAFRLIWIALILAGLVLFFLYPNWFTKEGLSDFVKTNSAGIFWTYLGICLVRGVFLFPSTPFVFAGILLFPDSLWWVFWISMLGIMATATYLYFASRFLEFDKLFGKKHTAKMENITTKLNKHGFWIVLGWAFFPLVPTDLICYISGTIRMNFAKYFVAIFIGEAVLVAAYVFFWANL